MIYSSWWPTCFLFNSSQNIGSGYPTKNVFNFSCFQTLFSWSDFLIHLLFIKLRLSYQEDGNLIWMFALVSEYNVCSYNNHKRRKRVLVIEFSTYAVCNLIKNKNVNFIWKEEENLIKIHYWFSNFSNFSKKLEK